PVSTLADAGLTVTDATGTLVTVMADVPICPSLVAVIVAEPAAAPVTRPLLLTVATAPLLVVQLTARPDSGLPLASLGVAVSCVVRPVDRLADAGVTLTVATGTLVTLMAAVAVWPSLVAVIVADPAAPPVTSPPEFTVATAALLVDQFTTRPDSGFPLASCGVAVSCTPVPISTLTTAGVTSTCATGSCATVTVAVSVAVVWLPCATTLNVPLFGPALIFA